ncbi:MAG TPA: hypothetical protein VIT38_08350 [Allosphingosinicella sp.]
MRNHMWIAFAALAIGDLALSPTSAARAGAMANAAGSLAPADGEADSAESLPLADAVERALSPDSIEANRLIYWVIASGDNSGLPFIVIDKAAATVTVFDPQGEMLGETPALLGIANGDESTPGIGERALSEMGPEERTTPAGRFPAAFGPAIGGHPVLWVDYATSVALHPVVSANRSERRLQRLRSPSPDDNRITYGCINVPARFFTGLVRPLFVERGGIVYILPDARPLEDVFPQLRSSRFRAASRAERLRPASMNAGAR